MKTPTSSHSAHRKVTPLSIRIDEGKKNQLAWIAQKQDRSVHYVLLQAVSEYISKETKRMVAQGAFHLGRPPSAGWDNYLLLTFGTDRDAGHMLLHRTVGSIQPV